MIAKKLWSFMRSPFMVMPLLSVLIAIGWVVWVSPEKPYAYDIADSSANILPNSSFETWEGASAQGWSVVSHGANKATVRQTQGKIDGHGMRVSIEQYKGSDVIVAAPSTNVKPSTKYFFKAFYETDTQLDILIKKTKQDGSVITELLRQYPDYDYPWSSMGSAFQTSAQDKSVRVLVALTGKGFIELDSAYIVETGPTTSSDANAPNLLDATQWELSIPEGIVASGNMQGATKQLQVTTVASALQASWEPQPVTVSPHELLTFSAQYSSDVETEIGMDFTFANGTHSYEVVQKLNPVSDMTLVTVPIEIPTDVVAVTPSLQLARIGNLKTANEKLSRSKQPASFAAPMVSITFDDGKLTSYLNGAQQLDAYGFKGTYYVNPGLFGTAGYMKQKNAFDLLNRGHQIGSHTNTHIDLTSFTPDDVVRELDTSNQAVHALGVQTIDFASPYGKQDDAILPFVMARQATNRGTEAGINTKQNFNPGNLKGLFMRKEVTDLELRTYLSRAKNYNGWLILIYHEIEVGDSPFVLDKATLERHLQIIKESGVQVRTVRSAMTQLQGN